MSFLKGRKIQPAILSILNQDGELETEVLKEKLLEKPHNIRINSPALYSRLHRMEEDDLITKRVQTIFFDNGEFKPLTIDGEEVHLNAMDREAVSDFKAQHPEYANADITNQRFYTITEKGRKQVPGIEGTQRQ